MKVHQVPFMINSGQLAGSCLQHKNVDILGSTEEILKVTSLI